jgi:hypothetical protein
MIATYYDAVLKLVGIENLIGGNINGPLSKIEFVEGFTNIPTEQAIQTKIAELQSDYDSKQYQRDRLEEYPNIKDCIHALLDGGDTLTELQAKRAEVKAKYPKPSE